LGVQGIAEKPMAESLGSSQSSFITLEIADKRPLIEM
jgi:hypothetical protein